MSHHHHHSRNDALAPWNRPGFRLPSGARAFALYGTLLLLLVFVQLPLVWMVITAFRTRGTAFRLTFLPRTTVTVPEEGRDPLPLPSFGAGERNLYFERTESGASEVSLEYRVAEAEAFERTQLALVAGSLWTAVVGPIAENAAVEYRFVINGKPASEEPAFARPGEMKKLAGGSLETPTGATLVAYREGGTLRAKPGMIDGRYYEIDAAPNADTYRLTYHRSFGEALASLYTLENFRLIIASDDFNFWHFFKNSLIVATLAGLLTVVICTLAAYAFAQKQFHFREPLFKLLLASMLVPGMIYMVPQFSITLSFGWLNSYQGMVVPHLANVFGLFLLRQYIQQIPKDLFHAAEIDGANEAQVFRSIVVPVCLPIMVTLFLLVFVGQWSNFLWQLIVNTGDSPYLTLPVGLQAFKGQNANDWERIMAGACFSILPIAVLFLSLQRYFLEGLSAGSVKE